MPERDGGSSYDVSLALGLDLVDHGENIYRMGSWTKDPSTNVQGDS